MEENKLYRVVGGKTGIYLGEWLFESSDIKITGNLEEYTPPTPLELEQLEEKILEHLFSYQEDRTCGATHFEAAPRFMEKIKPLISSMLQEKEERIKELESEKQKK